jgi:hypothetical protein
VPEAAIDTEIGHINVNYKHLHVAPDQAVPIPSCVSLAGMSGSARAHCGQTLVTSAEQDLWNVHGCDMDFMTFEVDPKNGTRS